MEDTFQRRASLGSKLPKFGTSKPVGSFLQRAPNGTYNGISTKGNFSVEKHIEHDRTSAFSLNWNKSKYPQNEQITRAPPNLTLEKTSQVMVQNDAHRLGVSKPGKQSNMLVSHREDLSDHVLSSSTKFTKGTQFGRTPYPGPSSAHKPLSNGFYSAKPPTGLYRPRANSATSRNFTNNVLSSDNKPFSHVRRSQSFSHSLQSSKYPTTGLTRSYSLHRETDMPKIHQLQHLPSRTDLKSRTAKQYVLSNGNEAHTKPLFTRTGYPTGFTSGLKKPVFTNSPVATAPLGYKLTRPSLQKANRPPYPRDIIPDGIKASPVAPANHKIELVSNGTDPLHKGDGKGDDFDNFSSCNNLDRQDYGESYFGDDVDELSISSLSSSDKNDFSEDFSDDFLDLEDGNKTITVEKTETTFLEKPSPDLLAEPDEKDEKKSISNNIDEWLDMNLSDLEDGNKTLSDEKLDKHLCEEPLYSLGDLRERNKRNSNNSEDWIDVNLSVQNEADTKRHSFSENGVSPDMDYREPSSLELSPSDSSDGTYMWDEEGMEPIGNVRRCESYESSEMNSLDILNNIETCDLEEDDLMLDVEIPEDPPCDPGECENMSRFDRSERNLRQQKLFWKRNPPRLNGQEQYHLSNPEHYHNGRGSSCLESPSDQKDSYGSPYCSPLSPKSPQAISLQEHTVMLDEMTLRHMVQDCTTVKTQLLKLKRLLQQGDDPESPIQDLQLCIPMTIEQAETETPLKTEDLLTEIQQLKEESRKKDDVIKQLQEQLKTRCKCQRETPEPKAEKLKQHDKFTQTNWRRSSPQILQCSSSTLSSTDHPSGKLTACHPTGVQNEPEEQIQRRSSFCPSEDSGAGSVIPASYLSDLLSARLKIDDGEDNPKNKKEERDKSHTQFDENKNVRLSTGDLAAQSSPSQQKDIKSKISVNASLPGQHVSSPKTLQCPKPKLQYSLAHRGNTLASPNSSSTLTDFKTSVNSSGPSLQQENLHTKKKQTMPNTHPVHQTTVNARADSGTGKMEKISSPAGQSLLTKTMPDARHLIPSTLPSTDKLSLEGALATHQRAPATEPSKPVSKLMPKGSLLRPPSNLPSKLKTPNISKPDTISPDVPKETQKPPGKASSSIVPRHTSPKKEGDTCSIPKRQSRLPQPKSH